MGWEAWEFDRIKLMKRILKYVFWLAVAGGIVYGSYYAYNNWWNNEMANKISSGAGAIGRTVSSQASDYAKTIASTTGQSVTSFFKSNIGSFIASVGEEILSAGVNLSGSTSSVPISLVSSPVQNSPSFPSSLPSGNVPAPTSSAYDAPPPPATIVVKAGEILSFSVNSGQIYKVDWGDGVKIQGATEADSITVIHHSWSNLGDYAVNVSVGNSVTSNVYSFPVRVYQ
jgi:hypothetical protein